MNSLVKRFASSNVEYEDAAAMQESPLSLGRDFAFAPVANPASFLAEHTDLDSSNAQARIKLAHGTTTLAFRFKGGIVVAVDCELRACSGLLSS
jgi:20S proteasome subunit beta 5